MKEFFYLDFFDCLPDYKEKEQVDINDPNWDQIQIFGSDIHKKLQNLK